MKIIYIDLETTGLYWNADAPVQIAAQLTEDGKIIDSYKTLVRTSVNISPQASAVHGIFRKDLADARGENEVLKDFIAWIKGYDPDCLIGYNSNAFDFPMLNCRCDKFGIRSIFDGSVYKLYDGYYDCVKIAKDKNMYNLKTLLGRKWNLGAVSEILGIKVENAHDALGDVEMLRQI